MRCYSHNFDRDECWLKKLGNKECSGECELKDDDDAER